MADTETTSKDTLESSYLGIRHISPWTIRYLRMAMDCGSRAKELYSFDKLVDVKFRAMFRECVLYMEANPSVGCCVNFDGDRRWQWSENIEPDAARQEDASNQ